MGKNYWIIRLFALLSLIGTVIFFILAYVRPVEWERHAFVYRPYNISVEVPAINELRIHPPTFPPQEYDSLLHLVDLQSADQDRVSVHVSFWNNDGSFDDWIKSRKEWYILGTLDDWRLLDETILEIDGKSAVQFTLLKQYDELPEGLWTIMYVDAGKFVYDISINRQRSYPAERIRHIINSIVLNNPEPDKAVF